MQIIINDHGEAFDWAWALWYWCTHNYSKFDTKHEAFCKITGEYRLDNIPSIDFENNDCDDYEMAVMYYHELTEENWEEHFNAFCDYMDNDMTQIFVVHRSKEYYALDSCWITWELIEHDEYTIAKMVYDSKT